MDAAYSLYDALVEINVPSEKARAVAQALERDVTATFATKTDLESARVALRADIETLGKDLRAEMVSLAKDLRGDMVSLAKELRVDMVKLRLELIIWMGGVQVLVAGVLFTALQLTLGR